ncbi:hypothetical protein GRF59_14465 [Paenibacillus sp. HJL G12]|uniref:Uncharacterized protein n=1 Tax=Paenibacillus dendrobii TaxID=2691084 RepID=A0A7X3IK43_9BACL|nr:hypothetical protein [Paenibacillus dendrobii]MWV44821.1 hypothetical protein [Paenibacillus dendrobii]
MESKVKELVSELDRLQDTYYVEYEEALYYRNKYHEKQSKYEKTQNKIEGKLKELYNVDPNYEYEVDVY